MKKLVGIVAAIAAVLGSGAAYACLVWLPQQARSQVDAQLTAISAEFDISYPDIAFNPFSRSLTLDDVTFQHRHLPLGGTIGSVEVKPAGDTATALSIANPVLRNGDQETFRAGLVEVASVDQPFVLELLETWKNGDQAALERLMGSAPGKGLNGVVVDNLQTVFDNVAFDLERLTIGSMDATRIENLVLQDAAWINPHAPGGATGIDVGLISMRSLDHAHLQQVYRALVEKRDDDIPHLLMATPDGFIENLEIRDIQVSAAAQNATAPAFSIGSIDIEGASSAEVRGFEVGNIRFDGEAEHGVVIGGIDAITLTSLPLWPLTESLKRAEDCVGAGCDDPEQAFEQLVELVAERGGLELGGISIDGLAMNVRGEASGEALYTLHSGRFSIPKFTFKISGNGRPYLENFTLQSEAEESYSISLFDTSSYPREVLPRMNPQSLEFLRLVGEVLREQAIPLNELESFGEISLKTDAQSGTAALLMQLKGEQRGEFDLNFALSGIPENVLTFKDLDQAGNAMLAQGSSLVEASLSFLDQGLFDLIINLVAKQSGQDRDQLISGLTTQMQVGLANASPELGGLILLPLQQFLGDPQSLRISLRPDQPVVLSAIPFLAQSDAQQLIGLLGFEIIANE